MRAADDGYIAANASRWADLVPQRKVIVTQVSLLSIAVVLAYVSWLAYSIGRLDEQLRQMKREAAQQSVQRTVGHVCPFCGKPTNSNLPMHFMGDPACR